MGVTVTDEKSFEEAISLAIRRQVDLLHLKLRLQDGQQVPKKDIVLPIRYAVESIINLCHELGKGREDLWKLREELLREIEEVTTLAVVTTRPTGSWFGRLLRLVKA